MTHKFSVKRLIFIWIIYMIKNYLIILSPIIPRVWRVLVSVNFFKVNAKNLKY